jgi:hypothetical protein
VEFILKKHESKKAESLEDNYFDAELWNIISSNFVYQYTSYNYNLTPGKKQTNKKTKTAQKHENSCDLNF